MKKHLVSKILFGIVLLAWIVAGCSGNSETRDAGFPSILVIFADDMAS